MQSRGPFHVHVESMGAHRRPDRIGLTKGKTGVPLFLLYLEGLSEPKHIELNSTEDVRAEIHAASSSRSQQAFEYLLPFFAAEGTQAHVAAIPLPAKITTGELIGFDSGYLKRTGVHTMRSYQDSVDLIAIPQAPTLLKGVSLKNFYKQTIELAARQGSFVLLDLPMALSPEEIGAHLRNFHAQNAAAFYPWLSQGESIVPPSPLAAALIQKTDRELGINNLPTNQKMEGGYKPFRQLLPAQLASALESRCNVFHVFQDGSVRIWGGATLSDNSDDQGRVISASRTRMALQQAVEELCEPYVLEPLSHDLPEVINVSLRSFFETLKGVFDKEHRQAFSTDVRTVLGQKEDVVEVDLAFRIPYAIEEIKLSLAVNS